MIHVPTTLTNTGREWVLSQNKFTAEAVTNNLTQTLNRWLGR